MPNILGIKIDNVSRTEALARVNQMIQNGGQHIITTPNPEMLVDAQTDLEFRSALNSAVLALPDGVGLVFASWFLNSKLQGRIPGSDFVMDLMELAANKGYSVYFLGGKEGIAQTVAEKLKIRYEKFKIAGADSGGQLEIGNWKLEIARIQNATPDILLVAFGHGTQEKWIARYLDELPSVKIAMGVGGVFDFISGKIRRAPLVFRKLGLEWLWRLMLQPWRIKRIWKAVIVFPILVLLVKATRK